MANSFNRWLLLLFITFTLWSCRTPDPFIEEPVESPAEETTEKVSEPTFEIDYPAVDREFRAVWVATVANIDWPSKPGLRVEEQQRELIEILDRAAALHFNAVIFQVRPAADTMYESPYEPWSSYLSGTMGQGPLPHYDPLEFAVREAHKRGLELHAWFNPYRAGHPSDRSEISSDHISKTNPELVHQFGDFLWLDPGLPKAKEHTLNVILDVVERYDIDGVHFDDYFYPYPSYDERGDFPDSLSWQRAVDSGTTLSKGDWRRNNVDQLIEELSVRIKELKPHVKFGISPFGIWRPGYPENTTGFDAYNELYADAKLWLKEGWLDYFTPQIYYRINQVGQPFPIMLQWWAEQNDHNIHMWPGLFTSRLRTSNRLWPLEEIMGQVYTARGFPDVTGTVHFSMRTFTINAANVNRHIAAGPYAKPAMTPVTPWISVNALSEPEVAFDDYEDRWSLRLGSTQTSDVRWWLVRSKYGNAWETDIIPGHRRHIVYNDGIETVRPDTILVSAVDRLGNESSISEPVLPNNRFKTDNNLKAKPEIEELIHREKWAENEPGGIEANAIRRNIKEGDTLQFRDLSLILEKIYTSELTLNARPDDDAEPEVEPIITEVADSVLVHMYRNGVRDRLIIKPNEAFNRYGYHIGLLDINQPGKLAHFELATVQSLSVDRFMALETGSAAQRFKVPHNIQKITLHHTGSTEPLQKEDSPAEILRGLYNWGASERNWWDVPYHYLIDLEGNIYQGRDPEFAGETNTSYDPRGHLLISVIGNYNLQEPTDAQKRAVAGLMATMVEYYDLTVEDIYQHGDWADTSCPGTHLQEFINSGELRSAILRQIDN